MSSLHHVVVIFALLWLVAGGTTVAHEAGHALVALLLDFELLEISCYNLRLSFDYLPPRLWWTRPSPGTIGHVRLRPRSLGGLALRSAAVDLAGTAAEQAALPLFALAALWSGLPPNFTLLLLICCCSKYAFGYQAGLRGWDLLGPDGRNLRIWRLGGRVAIRRAAYRGLHNWLESGALPRDLPDRLVRDATSLPDDTVMHAQSVLIAYLQAMDRREIVRAGTLLQDLLRCAQDAPQLFQSICYLEAALYAASVPGDAARARTYLRAAYVADPRECARPVEECWDGYCPRLRAEVAVLLAEGREDEAYGIAHAGLQRARNVVPERRVQRSSLRTELEWLRVLLRGPEGIAEQGAAG